MNIAFSTALPAPFNETITGRWLRADSAYLPLLQQAAANHFLQWRQGVCLKNDGKRCVSRVNANGKFFIIKHFTKTPICPLFSHARRTWRCTDLMAGFTPPCLAVLRTARHGELVCFPDCGDSNFWRGDYFQRPDVDQLAAEAGRLMAAFHNKGLYHGDAKAANFVVNARLPELPFSVLIVDCDKVRHYHNVPISLQLKNIAQFVALTGRIRSRSRWQSLTHHFLNAYAAARNPLPVPSDSLEQAVMDTIHHNRRVESNLQELQEDD
jgi:hypothetical protein